MTNSKYVAFDRLNEVYGFTVNFIFIFDEPSVKKAHEGVKFSSFLTVLQIFPNRFIEMSQYSLIARSASRKSKLRHYIYVRQYVLIII